MASSARVPSKPLLIAWWLVATALILGSSSAFSSTNWAALSVAEVARDYDIRAWTSENGLPPGAILALYQTRDGAIWIGTQDGLARFDGAKFVVYDRINTPELPSEPSSICEDSQHNLWIGSIKGGLARKTGNDFVPHRNIAGLPGRNEIYGLAEDRSGRMWGAIPEFVPLSDPFATNLTSNLSNRAAFLFVQVPSKQVFFSKLGALQKLNERTRELESFEVPEHYKGYTPVGIGETRAGHLLVGFLPLDRSDAPPAGETFLGIWRAGKWVRAPQEPDLPTHWSFGNIVEDRLGDVWFSGYMSTLVRFSKGKFTAVPFTSSMEVPTAALADREGDIWVGSSENVLRRISPRAFTTYTSLDGLVNDEVWTVHQTRDGSVLAGTEGGLSRLMPDGTFQNLPLPAAEPESNVRAVLEDVDGDVWFGTIRALHKWHGEETTVMKFPGDWTHSKVRVLAPSRSGGFWVGTVRSLHRWKNGGFSESGEFSAFGSPEVRAIAEGKDGSLWVGCFKEGLWHIAAGHHTRYSPIEGLTSENVWALHVDDQGAVWAGTDNGLNRIAQGTITTFQQADSLPARSINSILEDDFGRLWMSSDEGLFWAWRAELQEHPSVKRSELIHVVSYETVDGLPVRSFAGKHSNPAAAKGPDGRLWYPTPKGLVAVKPWILGKEAVPPLAVIERVRANGAIVAGTTPDDLDQAAQSLRASRAGESTAPLPTPEALKSFKPGAARVFEVQFGVNSYSAPEKTKFRYRLVGWDDAWISSGTRREAYFADLKPRRYRFEVVAGNHHGTWQQIPTSVEFTVEPFFYQTWWFFGLVGLTCLSAAAGGLAWRARETRRQHEIERLTALNEQRRRIAQDIHDELGASLTHIVQLTDAGWSQDRSSAGDSPTSKIAAIAGEAVNHINEIVWSNNPEYDTLEDLVAYLREYAASYLEPTSLNARFEFPEAVPPRRVSGLFRRGVLLIIKEALHNAVKHARANHLTLRIRCAETGLELLVSDDGAGFTAGDQRRFGNGLGSMLQRAAELGGKLTVDSRPGGGTRVTARIPFAEVT